MEGAVGHGGSSGAYWCEQTSDLLAMHEVKIVQPCSMRDIFTCTISMPFVSSHAIGGHCCPVRSHHKVPSTGMSSSAHKRSVLWVHVATVCMYSFHLHNQ